MAIFDYSYYKNIYGGTLDEDEFSRVYAPACDVISLLIGCDAEESEAEGVLRALCLEADLIAKGTGRDSRITKESLGDYSVSYSSRVGCGIDGVPVSPEAVTALTRAGFLTRWA